jgi:hypothetical protein
MSEIPTSTNRVWLLGMIRWLYISLFCLLIAFVITLFDSDLMFLLTLVCIWQLLIMLRIMLAICGVLPPKQNRRKAS